MAHKDWQKVKDTFHEALRRDPGERDKFLDAACAGDIEFRIEVESLLLSLTEATNFLEQPVIGEVPRPRSGWQLENGQVISHYRIVSPIASGGMGDVYLAEDEQLGRKAALKVLPEDLLENRERLQRFQREAQVVSALNHPNILTIFEFGKADDIHFLASEYVSGQTLRSRLEKGRLPLDEALDIAVQVVSALKAAHEAGVVHRDIKPENVMIRDDGYVKVLDFGLAKLATPPAADFEADTKRIFSKPGIIMGTVTYMSPEQARARPIDARSDLFSFGIVLFEMLTGGIPFAGETMTDVIAAIIQKTPRLASSYNSSVPDEIDRMIAKCLEKDREERYQTAADLLADLKRLLNRNNGITTYEDSEEATDVRQKGQVTELLSVRPTSETSRSTGLRRLIILGSAAALLVLLAIGYVWQRQTADTFQPDLRSLAVMPLRSINEGENYLGLGIADAVIMRISQTGGLTVRPTSAVRRYSNEDIDALTAARQLSADAVLEGTVQRAGDRLRVSVNLLRTSDGASLWAESFDMLMTDIFDIQDTVSQQVAARLRLQLNREQQAKLTKRYTANTEAYEYYLKGRAELEKRTLSIGDLQYTLASIGYFNKAIELDPNYALAYASLGESYMWNANFNDPDNPAWVERAQQALMQAESLDPQLAQTHAVRFEYYFSKNGGWNLELAAREVRKASELDPTIGHSELGTIYDHLGLDEAAGIAEFKRALEIDPTNTFHQKRLVESYMHFGRFEKSNELHRMYFGLSHAGALTGMAQLEEAEKLLAEDTRENPGNLVDKSWLALVLALKGNQRDAEALIPELLKNAANNRAYHHITYNIARVYAHVGNASDSVKWLRTTADTGMPNYSLFGRDPYLNRLRQNPAFIQFMEEMKTRNEHYVRVLRPTQ